jgi:hypothetical protein
LEKNCAKTCKKRTKIWILKFHQKKIVIGSMWKILSHCPWFDAIFLCLKTSISNSLAISVGFEEVGARKV